MAKFFFSSLNSNIKSTNRGNLMQISEITSASFLPFKRRFKIEKSPIELQRALASLGAGSVVSGVVSSLAYPTSQESITPSAPSLAPVSNSVYGLLDSRLYEPSNSSESVLVPSLSCYSGLDLLEKTADCLKSK